jgi:hypothetical protein
MKYMLDTNVCIGYLNGRATGVRARLESMSDNDVCGLFWKNVEKVLAHMIC